MQGLPSDDMSITSAVLTVHSQQVPLCIDPHQQAENWLRSKLAPDLSVVSATEPSMQRVLQQCSKIGTPCLVTSVSERLDPALLPYLSVGPAVEASGMRGPGLSATIAKDIPWTSRLKSRRAHTPGFQLYLTTELPDPDFSPSTALFVSVINFSAFQAVWEQLLGDTVRHEKPSLEASADLLAKELASDTRALKTHEEHILHLLQVLSILLCFT
jgi:dynein heavy chain, axonemal